MVNYAIMEDYDRSYKVKKREIACYSKSRMKDLFPDGNFHVYGETLPRNRKDEIDTIELAEHEFRISREDSHSSLFTRIVGYINNGSGEYIVLLRRNFLLLWIFLGLLAIGLALYLLWPKKSGILPPDYALIEDDPNAVTEVDENEPPDRVIIRLPKGSVDYEMTTDTGIPAGKTGHVRIFQTVEDGENLILDTDVTVNEDGTLPVLQLDFTILHAELKVGRYYGRAFFTNPDGHVKEIPVLILVRSTYGGAITVSYSDQILVDRATGGIDMRYTHGLDASHDCVLQLILDNADNEYLLAQSGALHPGQTLTSMTLAEDMAGQLVEGVYHGRIRVNLYNGESRLTDMNTDIEVTITVQ